MSQICSSKPPVAFAASGLKDVPGGPGQYAMKSIKPYPVGTVTDIFTSLVWPVVVVTVASKVMMLPHALKSMPKGDPTLAPQV